MSRRLLWAALSASLAACTIELDDVPGRACDEAHPCRAPRACRQGSCLAPDPTGGGQGGGQSGGGGAGGGGSGFDAGLSDAGLPRWQQKLHGFTATQVDPGCMLDIDPLRGNRVLATIRGTADSEDTAQAAMTDLARLPRNLDGRFRGRVTLPAPLAVRGLLPFAYVGTQTGQAFARIGFDAQGRLRVESDPGTVASAAVVESLDVPGGFPAGDHVVEVMWRVGVVRQVRVDDVLLSDLAVSGGASQPPSELALGPSRYDGADGGVFSVTLSTWQLADDLSLRLSDAP